MADSRAASIEGIFYTGESSQGIQTVPDFDARSGRVTLTEVMTGSAVESAALVKQPRKKTLFSSPLTDLTIPPRLANTRFQWELAP